MIVFLTLGGVAAPWCRGAFINGIKSTEIYHVHGKKQATAPGFRPEIGEKAPALT
jgi:hypothetical protein